MAQIREAHGESGGRTVGEVGRERERSVVGEGGRRVGWGRGDYFLFLKGGTHIFKNYIK